MTNNKYITNNLDGYPLSSSPQGESREALDINITSYLLKVKRRWKPALLVFFLTVAASALLGIQLKKTYQAEGKLLFKQNNAASLTGVGEDLGTLKPLLNNQTPLSTQIQVITSDPVLLQTIEKLQLEDEEGNPLNPDTLEKKLNIKLVGGTDVIQIYYKDEDPEIAAAVVNTLMDVYIKEQIRGNQAEPAIAKEFINKQLPQVESNVAKAESALRRFKEANNVIALQKEAESTVLQIANLNRDIASLAAQLQGTVAQTSTLQGQLGLSLQQAIALNQVGNSPSVQSILAELGNTEAELARERQRFQDQHPSIVSLEAKKADLNRKLRQEIRRGVGQDLNISQGLLNENNGSKENQLERYITLEIQKLNFQRQLASLYQSQQQQLARAKELPRLETEEQDLLRQVSAAQATYETLLGSLQEVQLAENQQTANAEIIEKAQLPEEGSSGGKLLLAFGVLLGLLFSNVSVVLLEMQDRSLKTVAEIKEKFPHKVLGVIPQESEDRQIGVIVQREPDSFTSELYRMIQANMKFMDADNAPQVILTTSSLPEEGKSTISANLAAAIAQLGRRVLLIDGDLRKPSQHHIWGVSNQFGVRDVVGKTQDFHTAVYQPMAKLDLLTAGAVRSNPLSLLDSPEMSSLILSTRQEYDLILIDAPPLPVTADVLTLSKLVDGILLVSRTGVVERESAELAIETLTNINKQVIGMVINGVKKKEFDNYSYTAKYAKRYFNKKNSLAERNGSANKPGTRV
ncbi:MAG: polysaccharide biosynthesis tyrosine autokinase [Xenococcaceae cyanobacterium MO_188.B32]|nr:polysaccharide biosynthesis tyrosine autokinase [Xenococcaceae cyanobacterium MO_188.B32]